MTVKTGNPPRKPRVSTRQLVLAALLVAITVFLAYSPIGMIPLPPPLTNATTVHIPVLLGAMLEGPWLGLLLGLTFGVCSLLIAISSPAISLTFFFRDPLVSILPRLLFPLIAWAAYRLWQRLVKKGKAADKVGVGVASVVGTLMNTVLCLGAIVLLHGKGLSDMVNNFIALGGADTVYLDNAGAWLVAVVGLPYGLSEAVVAAILVPLVKAALDSLNRRGQRVKAPAPVGVAIESTPPAEPAQGLEAMPEAAVADVIAAVENEALNARAAQEGTPPDHA